MVDIHPDLLVDDDLPVDFGRYTLLRLLGEGGMARVFEAELRASSGFRKRIALKVIHAGVAGRDEKLRAALHQEAQLGGLLHHPNVVDTYDFGEEDGHAWIAMELIDGIRLDQLLGRYGRLPADVALEVAAQVAAGLGHAHDLKLDGEPIALVHRDLKPSNVMISRAGMVKVMDFGIAKATKLRGDVTEAGVTKGTPTYMSPEQCTAEALDGRSDLFTFGALVYELVVGRPFFGGNSLYEIMAGVLQVEERLTTPGVLDAVDERVPGLTGLVYRCLRSDRDLRFDDAGEVERALRALQVDTPLKFPLKVWLRQVMNDPTDEVPNLVELERAEREEQEARVTALPVRQESTTAALRALGVPLRDEQQPTAPTGVLSAAPVESVPAPVPEREPAAGGQTLDMTEAMPRRPARRKSGLALGVFLFGAGGLLLALIALGLVLLLGGEDSDDRPAMTTLPSLPVIEDQPIAQPPTTTRSREGEAPRDPAPTPRHAFAAVDEPAEPTPEDEPEPVAVAEVEPTPAPSPAAEPEPVGPSPGSSRMGPEVHIRHDAPATVLLGSPVQLNVRLEPRAASCKPVLFSAPWSGSTYASQVLEPTGGGQWVADLFVPYSNEYRSGVRYRIKCVTSSGTVLATWPEAGHAHQVPSRAR